MVEFFWYYGKQEQSRTPCITLDNCQDHHGENNHKEATVHNNVWI